MSTAKFSETIFGDKLYQIRARQALPILVRQALLKKTIFYEDLAKELGMPNPRNLNYVLGSIGVTLNELSVKWHEKVPLLNTLVINKTTGIPGEGFDEFLPRGVDVRNMSRKQKDAAFKAFYKEIYSYPKWNEVLRALGLRPLAK